MRHTSAQERERAASMVQARCGSQVLFPFAIFALFTYNLITFANAILKNKRANLKCQIVIKSRFSFYKDLKTILNLIPKFNATGSVDYLPRRPKRHATTRQQDRYIRVHVHVNHPWDRNVTARATALHTFEMRARPVCMGRGRQESETASPATA